MSVDSHVPGMSITSAAVQSYFPALPEGIVSRVDNTNVSNMAAVAVASQSTPLETRCSADTTGPACSRDKRPLCIELTPRHSRT